MAAAKTPVALVTVEGADVGWHIVIDRAVGW
jgi:hypothetical protein